MVIDSCFYVSPFLSVTARQPHAAALPLKSYFRLSTLWASLTMFTLASLAKGWRIGGYPPDSQSHPNSRTPKSSNMLIQPYKATQTQQPQAQQANPQKNTPPS